MLNDLLVCIQFEVINEFILNFKVCFVGLISVPYRKKIFMVFFMPTQKSVQLSYLLLNFLNLLLFLFHLLLYFFELCFCFLFITFFDFVIDNFLIAILRWKTLLVFDFPNIWDLIPIGWILIKSFDSSLNQLEFSI
jgi:hypothetical protein